MNHAFQIPTTRKHSIFRRVRSHIVEIKGIEYTVLNFEYYQYYKLPIIQGNILDIFVKVNSN